MELQIGQRVEVWFKPDYYARELVCQALPPSITRRGLTGVIESRMDDYFCVYDNYSNLLLFADKNVWFVRVNR